MVVFGLPMEPAETRRSIARTSSASNSSGGIVADDSNPGNARRAQAYAEEDESFDP